MEYIFPRTFYFGWRQAERQGPHCVCECVSWPLNSGLIGVQMQTSQHTCYHTCPPLQYHILFVLPHVPAITIPHSLRATTRARHYNTTFSSCYNTCPPLQYHIPFVLPHNARHYNTTFASCYHTCRHYNTAFTSCYHTSAYKEYYVLQENATFTTCASQLSRFTHCKEIWIYVFPEQELRGLSPDFHIHVSVSDLYIFFSFVLYSALLHLPPLRFHCADGCWDRTQDRCNWCIGSQTL